VGSRIATPPILNCGILLYKRKEALMTPEQAKLVDDVTAILVGGITSPDFPGNVPELVQLIEEEIRSFANEYPVPEPVPGLANQATEVAGIVSHIIR
jgi:aspartyl/asparaginyl beta-hydroxylase (cupin superfamily)